MALESPEKGGLSAVGCCAVIVTTGYITLLFKLDGKGNLFLNFSFIIFIEIRASQPSTSLAMT
jgi:hypothetical protein